MFGLAAASLLFVACGGGGDDDGVEALSDEELGGARAALASEGVTSDADDDIRYFSAIQSALDLFGARAASAAQESLEAGDERARFFASLTNAGAGVAFIDTLEALQEIVPSEGYENDHARVVQLYEERARTDARFGEAAEAEDLTGVITGNLRLARRPACGAGPVGEYVRAGQRRRVLQPTSDVGQRL